MCDLSVSDHTSVSEQCYTARQAVTWAWKCSGLPHSKVGHVFSDDTTAKCLRLRLTTSNKNEQELSNC